MLSAPESWAVHGRMRAVFHSLFRSPYGDLANRLAPGRAGPLYTPRPPLMAITYAPKLRLAPLWPALAAIALATVLAALLLPGPLSQVARQELQNELRLLSATFRWPDSTRAAAADGTLQRRIVDVVAATPYRLSVIALDGATKW